MGKYSRCVLIISENDMRYPELHKKHNNVDGNIIIHKLPKDGAVRAAWIKAILTIRKEVIKGRKSSYFSSDIPAWLIS